MSKRSDFKVTDRVWHESRRSIGTVEQNTYQGLFIRFEDWPEKLTCFDDDWFRVCPALLRHAKTDDKTDDRLLRARKPTTRRDDTGGG